MEKTFIKIKMLRRFGEFKDFPKVLTVGIVKETNKAILASYQLEWNSKPNTWIPKSCFQLIKII